MALKDANAYRIIVTPTALSEREQALFRELASQSRFDPRGHFVQEKGHGG